MDTDWGDRLPNCVRAMNRVKVAFRASAMNWKGRIGGCVVNTTKIGLKIFVRMGEKYGRVIVWYSSTEREPKAR